jgi:hypothetical protein
VYGRRLASLLCRDWDHQTVSPATVGNGSMLALSFDAKGEWPPSTPRRRRLAAPTKARRLSRARRLPFYFRDPDGHKLGAFSAS